MQPDEDSSSGVNGGEAGSAEKEEGEPRASAVLARHVAEYRKAHGRLRGEAGLGQPDAAGHVEHLGRPDGKACRDYHRQCLEWADSVGLPVAGCRLSACLNVCVACWAFLRGWEGHCQLLGGCLHGTGPGFW